LGIDQNDAGGTLLEAVDTTVPAVR
jgi:hypothetical protein